MKRRLSEQRLGGLRNQLAPLRPQPLRAPEAIWADSRALEEETEGLLEEIRGGV